MFSVLLFVWSAAPGIVFFRSCAAFLPLFIPGIIARSRGNVKDVHRAGCAKIFLLFTSTFLGLCLSGFAGIRLTNIPGASLPFFQGACRKNWYRRRYSQISAREMPRSSQILMLSISGFFLKFALQRPGVFRYNAP